MEVLFVDGKGYLCSSRLIQFPALGNDIYASLLTRTALRVWESLISMLRKYTLSYADTVL